MIEINQTVTIAWKAMKHMGINLTSHTENCKITMKEAEDMNETIAWVHLS